MTNRIDSHPKRVAAVSVLVVLFLVLLAGVAWAATPEEIYNDFAEDGDLDGDYTVAEIEAVFTDPVILQYGDQAVLDELRRVLSEEDEVVEGRGVFPFTGAELLLILFGGVGLVAVGLLVRRGVGSR